MGLLLGGLSTDNQPGPLQFAQHPPLDLPRHTGSAQPPVRQRERHAVGLKLPAQ